MYESRSTSSEQLRTQIRALVDEGELTDAEILGSIAQAYGGRVLLVPRATGFDALAWALPAAALVCARRRPGGHVPALAARGRRRRRPDGRRPRARGRGPRRRRTTERAGRRRSTGRRSRMNPDQLAELEDERRFLLRSLRDLDAELAAGDVDPVDYETLRDGYTKRAADVLRGIEEGKAALPSKRPAPGGASGGGGRRRAWRSPSASASSPPGRPASAPPATRSPAACPAARTRPRCCRRRATCSASDPRLAQDAYAQVLDRDPDNPEALTYSGWLLYFASAGASDELRDMAVATAKEQLARAVAVDPAYPDPHCFLAVIAADADGDMTTARTEADAVPGERPARPGPPARRGHVRHPGRPTGVPPTSSARLSADRRRLIGRRSPGPGTISARDVPAVARDGAGSGRRRSRRQVGGGSTAAVATWPSASGVLSTHSAALRQSGRREQLASRGARARRGAPGRCRRGCTARRRRGPRGAARGCRSALAPSVRRGSATTSRPSRAPSGTSVSMHRTYGLDHSPLIDSLASRSASAAAWRRPALRQRALGVVAVPVVPAARLGVADDEDAQPRASPVSCTWRAVHWRTTSAHSTADTMPTTLRAIITPRLSA